jgi:hypothetical protein
MIYYSKCSSIVIDGTEFIKGFLGLTWCPSAAAKAALAAYEASVVAELNKLALTRTGWSLLRALFAAAQARRKEVRIVPYTKADEGSMGPNNAFASPRSGRDAAPLGVRPFQGGADEPGVPGDERYQLRNYTGTGKGSSSNVHFTPHPAVLLPIADDVPICPTDGKTVVEGGCRLVVASSDTSNDTLLLHELIHSLRELRGQLNQVPTWIKSYDNQEEFFAVLVANIYTSEHGRKDLRANHHSFSLLAPHLNTSEKFFGKDLSAPWTEHYMNRKLVSKFVSENYGLCADINRHVHAEFNPIAEFMRHSELYPH